MPHCFRECLSRIDGILKNGEIEPIMENGYSKYKKQKIKKKLSFSQ